MSTTRIGFSGDVAYSRYYANRFEEDLVDEALVAFLNDTDHTVLNVEGAVAAPTHAGTFVHTNDPRATKQFRALGGDIWNLANNHMMDAEANGLAETLRNAKEAGAQTIGAGMTLEDAATPAILPTSGGIGLLGIEGTTKSKQTAATPTGAGCLSIWSTDAIEKAIQKTKASCRWCVLVIHSGSEFLDIPSSDVREKYRSFLDMGADAIVAHHPHVPQNYEYYRGKPIFYSLGNFIFDTDYQRAQFHTDTGVLLKLTFTENDLSFEAIGTKIDRSTGKISKAPLPAVFRPLTDKDYEYIDPIAGKRFLEHEVRRRLFLKPEEFKDFTEEDWIRQWNGEAEKGRVVMKICMDARKRFDPEKHDPAYAELEAYLI